MRWEVYGEKINENKRLYLIMQMCANKVGVG